MGLASALSTSLTGLNASETTIDVVGNNLANSNTVGFKASSATFATQFLQTQSLGSAPTEANGGTNPRQVGLGTMVAAITPNFEQGTVELSSSPTDMAIQGDGFFIVQGNSGEHLYTRNGIFKLNSDSQLVTATGNRVLGYGVDENFNVQRTTLTPLTIPLGSAKVAKSTENVYLEGTLIPNGNLATTSEIIDTAILGDAAYTRPTTTSKATAISQVPDAANAQAPTQSGASGLQPSSTYNYCFTYYNLTTGTNGAASTPISVTLGAGENRAQLTNIPSPPSGYGLKVYRTAANPAAGATYYEVAAIPSTSTTYTDSMDDTTLVDATKALVAGTTPAAPVDPTLASHAGASYYYKTVFYDSHTGTEGVPSATTQVAFTGLQNQVVLDNLPSDPTGQYDQIRLYRTLDDGSASGPYYLVGQQTAVGGATFTDSTPDSDITRTHPTNHPVLNQTSLTGNYNYYVTFFNGSQESRPSDITSITVTNGRVQLGDLPTVDATNPNQWTGRRIYRNVDGGNTYYEVAEFNDVTSDLTYTDATSDTELATHTQTLDFDGEPITTGTLLSNLVRRVDGTDYQYVFPATGVLSFTGQKGGRSTGTEHMTITAQSTVQDLIDFMRQSMGIQTPPGPDPNHPIPNDASGVAPGAYVKDSRLEIVSNTGTGNACTIALTAMQLETSTGTISLNLPFSETQAAVGESAITDFIAYDSLGDSLAVRLTMVLESRSDNTTVYRWLADSTSNDSKASPYSTAVGTGTITFDGLGNYVSNTSDTVTIRRDTNPAETLSFKLDFSAISGLAATRSSLAVSRQDGSGPGVLTSFIVGEDGLIRGVFSNGVTRDLGQIRLARFGNPAGLQQEGENLYASGVNSGLPVEGDPNEQGIGSIVAGSVELSNTDIGGNLIDLILASTMYRGNARVITTVQQMLDELLALRR
jgi:flagellar hook-basal body protein